MTTNVPVKCRSPWTGKWNKKPSPFTQNKLCASLYSQYQRDTHEASKPLNIPTLLNSVKSNSVKVLTHFLLNDTTHQGATTKLGYTITIPLLYSPSMSGVYLHNVTIRLYWYHP